jgi:L-fuculose-phosphate aldolase
LLILLKNSFVWITPKGIDKGTLIPQQIVRVNTLNDSFSCLTEGLLPSTEIPIHTAIYDARKDINAILHAHSPSLVTFSIARKVSFPLL